MVELRVRNRARLRRKDIAELAARLSPYYGTKSMFGEEDPIESGEWETGHVLLLHDEIIGLIREGKTGLSVRGVLKYGPTRRFVTVDMGAVRFVTNGADIMGPGIVDADPEIAEGDFVWVREERHGKPLAVGISHATGPALKAKPKGKQIKNLAFVGDRLWLWGQEEAQPKPATPEPPAPE